MNNLLKKTVLLWVFFCGMAFVGSASAWNVLKHTPKYAEWVRIINTPSETSVIKSFTADDNAHAAFKTSVVLDSSNGRAYKVYGQINSIIFGNIDDYGIGKVDSPLNIPREGTGTMTVLQKNCNSCDAIGHDVLLIDQISGGSLFGYNVEFQYLGATTHHAAFRVDPGQNNPKKLTGFDANLTNIVLGKGNNGKAYGFRFNPATLAVEFFENIGGAGERKTGEIKMNHTVTCEKKVCK